MILMRRENPRYLLSWPRTSGDDPRRVDKSQEKHKLAPHERG